MQGVNQPCLQGQSQWRTGALVAGRGRGRGRGRDRGRGI